MSLPRPVLVADLCIRTPWGMRRNRFYFQSDVALTGLTPLENCCNTIHTEIGGLLTPLLTTQIHIERVEGRWYGTGTTGFEANSTTASLQGDITATGPNTETDAEDYTLADTLPDEAVLIIQKRTGNTGRSQMGRWFISGLGEKIQNAGEIDAAVRGEVAGIADAMSNDITVTGSFSTVLHHRHYNKKDSQLMPITKCYAIRTLGTRKDRRRPLKLDRL